MATPVPFIPHYTATRGRQVLSGRSKRVQSRIDYYNRMARLLDASYAGAVAFNLLATYVWIDACQVNFVGDSQYDDTGEIFKTVSVSVDPECIHVTDDGPITEANGVNGQYDAHAAAATIEDFFVDDDPYIIHGCVSPSISTDTFTLMLNRRSISALLNSTRPVNGIDAFQLLFPEYAESVLKAA